MMFANVTEEHLVLNIKRTYIHRIIAIGILGAVMIPLKFLQPYLHYWHLLCCFVCFIVVGTTIIMFSAVFQSLGTAAAVLNKCFKVRQKCVLMYNQKGIFCACVLKLIYDRQSVGQSILVPGTRLGPVTNFLLSR
jgi:hypothetical protein